MQEADAEDMVQDVLLRLARRMPSFRYDPSRSFRGWLRTVTEHALADYLSERRRHGLASGDERVLGLLEGVEARVESIVGLKDRFDGEALAIASARAQARVEPKTWEAFRLTAHEGLSGDDAAGRLGMTTEGVFKAKSRVLKFLREEIRRLAGP